MMCWLWLWWLAVMSNLSCVIGACCRFMSATEFGFSFFCNVFYRVLLLLCAHLWSLSVNWESVCVMVKVVEVWYGKVDVFVNNVGWISWF